MSPADVGARRVLVAWCPDWPVVSAQAEARVPPHRPAACLAANQVLACNQAAREEGVRRGMRRRDAQSRCPELALLEANPEREGRDFEPVLAAVEELRPGVAPLRPGLLAVHSPARFYGGEPEAAAVIAEHLVAAGVWDCRFGVADDLFTAEQAARAADQQDCRVVPPGESAAFLARLDVRVLEETEIVDLLRRLGIRTLGDLAELPAREVHSRFGAHGARLHRLVRGMGREPLAVRQPPPDLVCQVDFEPPLTSVEAVGFSIRRTAEQFVHQIARRNLVCTRVLVEAECETEGGNRLASSRSWLHARWFRASDLVDRVHWQLGARIGPPDRPSLPGPVSTVRLVPETLEADAAHAEGLWGGSDATRVERGVARVQAMLGYEAVVTPTLQGGRGPADRQARVPWGERATGLRSPELPWPGSIPAPAPARVFPEPWPALVVGADGRTTRVTDRGVVTSEPDRFRARAADGDGLDRVAAWAGPWPIEESWWDPDSPSTPTSRFQLVGVDGRAWLMSCTGDRWWTEASYD